MFAFDVTQSLGSARTAHVKTAHGTVETPAFLPVGTAGAIKGVTPDQARSAGTQMILANTYHLMLRPGPETVAKLGGLHAMMGWDAPVLTDSGGYQVFSLAHLRKLDDRGVTFRSHVDGSEIRLTPQRAIEIQRFLSADIMMQLDECPAGTASTSDVAAAVRRSLDWAKQCKDTWDNAQHLSHTGLPQALFGIQQGGTHADLRAESAQRLVEMDFPGYAIGGLSVGEGHAPMCDVLATVDKQFPKDKPRYLMGVGEPRDILAAVQAGIDMFDCVLPTRNGRNGQAFTWSGRLRLRNAQWSEDPAPIDPDCSCLTCRTFSRGTLRHLFLASEMLGPTLVSIHNLHFFGDLMRAIREAIREGTLAARAREWVDRFYRDDALDNDDATH